MSLEENIAYESPSGKFYVYRIKKGDYEVRENGATHAVKRGTFYFPKDDVRAMDRAIEHAKKLDREKDYRHNPRKSRRKAKRNGWSARGSKAQIQAGIRGIRSMMKGLKKSSPRYINLNSRLKNYQRSLIATRKTRRNDGETPVKKSNLKWIIGGGVAVFALYYVLRKRASAAAATPTFQTPTATPVNLTVRVGQNYAAVAKMLNDYRVPFRVIRQDGKAFSITKDRNPNRWNLSVNRGVIVGAYKG